MLKRIRRPMYYIVGSKFVRWWTRCLIDSWHYPCDSFFQVKTYDKKGRCIVATRDISPNEIIFKEEPLFIGPRFVNPEPVCLGCFTPLSPISSSKCQKCYWPICDSKCPGIQTTHRSECDFLSVGRDNVRKKNNYKWVSRYLFRSN